MPHENRSGSEGSFDEIDRQTMDILQDRNRLDLELYEFAVELFHSREAAAAQSTTLAPRPVERNRFVPYPTSYKLDRRALIRSVSAAWVADESSRTLEIAVDFTATAPVAELTLELQVNDVLGNVVWATNTKNENLELNYKTGRDCRASFLVECELSAGEYFVSLGLSEPRRFGFHEHWIDHATLFTVTPPRAAGAQDAQVVKLQRFWSAVVAAVEGQ